MQNQSPVAVAVSTAIGMTAASLSGVVLAQDALQEVVVTGSRIATVDGFGHVTGLASATVSIGDGTITVTAGTGLTGGGSFTTNQAGNSTITVGLSSPVSVANGGTGATDAAGARTNLDVDQAGTALALAIALG